jgi:hypothetical protein
MFPPAEPFFGVIDFEIEFLRRGLCVHTESHDVLLSLVAFEDAQKKPTGLTESVKNNTVEQSEIGAGSSLTEEATGGNVPARLQTLSANGKPMGRSRDEATDSIHRTSHYFLFQSPKRHLASLVRRNRAWSNAIHELGVLNGV